MSKFLPLAFLTLAPLALGAAAFRTPSAPSPAAADRDAVERAVLDYVEAIYEGKPELIDRSVHPGLEKLGSWRPEGTTEYRTPGKMTFEQLRELAAHWHENAQGELTHEVVVLDVLDLTASAKLSAAWGIDYMHLMKQRDGRWQIVQVLWQSHPPRE